MRKGVAALVLALAAAQVCVPAIAAQPVVPTTQPPVPAIELFFRAAAGDDRVAEAALAEISAGWRTGYAAMLVDLADLLRRSVLANPLGFVRFARLVRFLEQQTIQSFGENLDEWRDWLWNQPYEPHPRYWAFKAALYRSIDPRFEAFFREPFRSTIRLDQVDWGGVAVNGIPPLDFPAHVPAAEAAYLKDSHIVFGVFSDDEARAYPKRILAWHELARDRVGSLDLTLVYCTLCGTAIAYDSRTGGATRTFGTSGLLYLSNKLMFDEATHSLWSSLDGTPVVGPLVGSGLQLAIRPVVTTTWGEWKREHPETTVLSLDTGFRRDYSEGAAYRGYFATDRLMFHAPTDSRLANKAEVLVLRMGPAESGAGARPVVIAADFLQAHPVYELDAAGRQLVVVTTPAGANRVYERGPRHFVASRTGRRLLDADGRDWIVDEDALRAAFDPELRLPRVPAHRAFWFGWYAQHPDTILNR
jgi:hypothetical protein